MGRLRSGGNGGGSSSGGGEGEKRRLASKGGAGSSIFSHGSSGRGRGMVGVAAAAATGMGQRSSLATAAAMTGTLEQEGEAVASLQTLNVNVLSVVLAFLLAHEVRFVLCSVWTLHIWERKEKGNRIWPACVCPEVIDSQRSVPHMMTPHQTSINGAGRAAGGDKPRPPHAGVCA